MFESVDYLDVARTRYTDQFQDSVNFDYLMIVWLMGYQELQQLLISMLSMKDVDAAYGYQLDVIGNIVGQPRSLEEIDATGFFGFESDSGALPFGSMDNQSGGIYLDFFQSDAAGAVVLPDATYRAFIKAKIVANNSGGTPEDIILATKQLFAVDTVELIEDFDESGVINLYIGRPWNDEDMTSFPGLDETAIAKRLLPIPAGVRIEFADVDVAATLSAVNNWQTASDVLYVLANSTLPQNIGNE